MNFLMFKLVLEKAEEPEIKLPTSAESSKKQESSRKTSISALLTVPKPLTVWITINCGRDEWWGKLGLALVSRAMLTKTVIQLSTDEWSFLTRGDPTLGCMGSMIRLIVTSKRAYAKGPFQDCCCQGLCLHSESLLTHTSTLCVCVCVCVVCASVGDIPTLAGRSGSVFCRVTELLSPGFWCTQTFFGPSKSEVSASPSPVKAL